MNNTLVWSKMNDHYYYLEVPNTDQNLAEVVYSERRKGWVVTTCLNTFEQAENIFETLGEAQNFAIHSLWQSVRKLVPLLNIRSYVTYRDKIVGNHIINKTYQETDI